MSFETEINQWKDDGILLKLGGNENMNEERIEMIRQLSRLSDALKKYEKAVEEEKNAIASAEQDYSNTTKRHSFMRFFWPVFIIDYLVLAIGITCSQGNGGGVFFTILLAVGIAVGWGFFAKKRRDDANQALQQKEYYSAETLERIKTRCASTKKQAVEVLSEFIGVVPDTYFYSVAVDYMLSCIRDGRAENLKEAMNLYEEQMHRWRVEQSAAEQAEFQRQCAENLASIKRSSQSTAVSSGINAAANVYRLFR